MLGLVFGLTVSLYGIAIIVDARFPSWLGLMALLGGVATGIAGVVMAYTGFSGLAMAINMPASSLLLLWLIILGVTMWRRSGRLENSGSA